MGQLSFFYESPEIGTVYKAPSNGTLSFVPLNLFDSISLNNLNVGFQLNNTVTMSFGLYSLSGGTLNIINSGAGTMSGGAGTARNYLSMSTFSATSNLTPGTWWLGLLITTGGNTSCSLVVNYGNLGTVENSPPGFKGGAMTESTAALPSAYNTSNLSTTGNYALQNPIIIITA